ncbi:hypothetical protein CPT_Machias_114 [Staphylococcus phage Machias]|nr:hypothetical protein CPT_Machias_114 [Staphylococcus phage Machias]
MAKQSDVFSKKKSLYRKNGRKIPSKFRKMDVDGTWFYRFDHNRFIIDNLTRFMEDKELKKLLNDYRNNYDNKEKFNNDCYFFELDKDIPKLNKSQLKIFFTHLSRKHIGKDFLKNITLKDNSKLEIKEFDDLEIWSREPDKEEVYDVGYLDMKDYRMIAHIDHENEEIVIHTDIEEENPKSYSTLISSLESIEIDDYYEDISSDEIRIKLNDFNLRKVFNKTNSKIFKVILPVTYNYEGFDDQVSFLFDNFSKTYIKQLEKEEYDKKMPIGGQPYHLRPENRPYYAKRRIIKDWNIYEIFDEDKDGYKLFSVKDDQGFIYLIYYIGKNYHGKGIIVNGKESPELQDPSNYRKSVKLKDIYYSVLISQAKYNLMKKNKFDIYTAFDTSNPKYMTISDEENIHTTDFLIPERPFKIRQTKFREDKISNLKDKFVEEFE